MYVFFSIKAMETDEKERIAEGPSPPSTKVGTKNILYDNYYTSAIRTTAKLYDMVGLQDDKVGF